MSAANGDNLSREQLIQQTAERLSPELQAEYYRILRYCRSLPQNDEILLVLDAIQILFSLTIDVPNRMAAEGEKMERLLQPAVEAQEKAIQLFREYQTQLDQRLARLPDEIVKRVQPEVIAAKITESLRQQFAETTIPATAAVLRTELEEVRAAIVEFKDAASSITDACYGAVAEARRATQELRFEAQGLSRFHWSWAYGLGALALVIGVILGGLIFWWATSPAEPRAPAVAPQAESPPPVVGPKVRQNPRH